MIGELARRSYMQLWRFPKSLGKMKNKACERAFGEICPDSGLRPGYLTARAPRAWDCSEIEHATDASKQKPHPAYSRGVAFAGLGIEPCVADLNETQDGSRCVAGSIACVKKFAYERLTFDV